MEFQGLDLLLAYVILRGDIEEKFFSYGHNQERSTDKFLSLVFYLPLTTDRKGKVNKYQFNVNLNPIDCSFDYLRGFHVKKFIFSLIF